MRGNSEHWNSPNRHSEPWIDLGLHKTRTAGTRRFWLYPNEDGTFSLAIAGEGSTCGATREEAIANGEKW